MFDSTVSKSLRVAAAVASVAAAMVVSTPAAHAKPDLCTGWAWAHCDPQYDRFDPMWGVCFDAWYDACEAAQPGPPPNIPWTPWPYIPPTPPPPPQNP
ncbi:hypothetical protein [Caulobacter sp.]|uniref:hypothetical protein n=1 Tax=Caulobacter sp. TaxID=78 RepID=UPI003BB0AAE7